MPGWRNLESEITVSSVDVLLSRVRAADAIKLIANSIIAPTVFITDSCYANITRHIGSSNNEMGGILFGKTYALNYTTYHGYNYIGCITDSVPSTKYKNSFVSLRMGSEIWSDNRALFNEGKLVIGWYHSHPHLGAFFSSTDRQTQRSFFNNDYSLGLVIDPYKQERKLFFGATSKEVISNVTILSNSIMDSLLN